MRLGFVCPAWRLSRLWPSVSYVACRSAPPIWVAGTTDLGQWWGQGAPVSPDATYRNYRWPGCMVEDCGHMYFNDDVFSAATASVFGPVGRPGAQL